MERFALGIDLGDTIKISSGILTGREEGSAGGLETLSSLASIPSRMAFGPRKRLFGGQAKPHFSNTIQCLKSFISGGNIETLLRTSHDIGGPLSSALRSFQKKHRLNSSFARPQLIAMMMGYIRRRVEQECGPAVKTMLAVPHWYAENQLQELADCAVIGGLHPIGFVTDIVAVALAYGISQSPRVFTPSASTRVVAFLDIGYSDCTSTVVTFERDRMKVHEIITDPDIAGRDIDHLLLQHFTHKIGQKSNVVDDERATATLLVQCEKLKRLLSGTEEEGWIDFSTVTKNPSDNFRLTKGEFEGLVEGWLDRVFDPLIAVLTLSGLDPSDVDALVLLGGSSRLSCVLKYAQSLFGDSVQNITAMPEMSAANGAAQACALIQARNRNNEVVHDTRTMPFEIQWDTPYDGAKGSDESPWIQLGHDHRLSDLELVSLLETELAMEEADKLAIDTKEVHDTLVQHITLLSEKLDEAGAMTTVSEGNLKHAQKTLDSAILWLSTSDPREMTEVFYEAHIDSLRVAGNHLKENATLSHLASSDPTPTNGGYFTPEQRRVHMFNMGTYLIARFLQSRRIEDIEEAIPCLESALNMIPPDDPELKDYLECLGMALCFRFDHKANQPDLENAISHYRRGLQASERLQTHAPALMNNMGLALVRRYEYLGNIDDIEEAISLFEKLLVSSPDGDPRKPGYMSNLGSSLGRRFEQHGERSSINRAVSLCRAAVETGTLRSQASFFGQEEQRFKCAINLGIVLQSRFDRFGDIKDIEDSVRSCEEVVQQVKSVQTEKPMFYHALGTALLSRFNRVGNMDDITRAILACEDAVRLAKKGDPERPKYLASLGACRTTRYGRDGQLADIERAIEVSDQAVNETPDSKPEKYAPLHTLGDSLLRRFFEKGEIGDINRAILTLEKAARLTKNHISRPLCFTTLGRALAMRYEQRGDITDIDKAIRVQEKGTDLLPDSHMSKPNCLDHLGRSLSRRFTRLFQISDIDKAVLVQERALALLPPDHSERFKYLMNLGSHFQTRFDRTNDIEDARRALDAHRSAIKLLPSNHSELALSENGLASSLVAYFEKTGDTLSLDEAIELLKKAAERTSDHKPQKNAYCANLGSALMRRFDELHQVIDINQAIYYLEKATQLTPEDHPDRPGCLNMLGRSLSTRYVNLGDSADLENGILRYSEAARSRSGAPWTRFTCAKNWVICAKGTNHCTLRDAYDCLLDLLPRVAWLGLKLEHRREEIAKMGSIACDAAADAIAMGDYETAVTWLEKGRFIMWSQGLQLRSPVKNLKDVFPDLARQVEEISMALERSIHDGSQFLNTSNKGPYQELDNKEKVARRQRSLADRWDKLLAKIRQKRGFKYFLLSKTFQDLSKASKKYPVAIINPSSSRCDVLLLLTSGRVQLIPLSIKYEKALHLEKQLRALLRASGRTWRRSDMEINPETQRGVRPVRISSSEKWSDILGILWKEIANPILQALKLSPSPNPPRLCWCPTGIFSRLPLHAAGDYRTKNARASVHDFVISSYTPTLGLLLRPPSDPKQRSAPTVLAIGVSKTTIPKMTVTPLPMVKQEIAAIRQIVQEKSLFVLQDEQATPDNILKALSSCSSLHLACHAYQDLVNPLLSAFLVHGEKLYLSQLIKESLSNAELAFLSACQTARGDENTPDEAMHLAGGMLFAGFRSVIATMWSIDDADGPAVTKAIYRELFGKPSFDGTQAAAALHQIIGKMREKGAAFERWVPFISLGM